MGGKKIRLCVMSSIHALYCSRRAGSSAEQFSTRRKEGNQTGGRSFNAIKPSASKETSWMGAGAKTREREKESEVYILA